MTTTAGVIDVEVQARLDKLEAGLRDGEAKVKAASERMEKTSNFKFGGKLVEGAARATAAMGTVELAVKSVNGVIDAMNGEWDKAAETIKQLPAGIGPAAQAIEGLLARMTGHTEQMAAIQAELQESQARGAKQDRLGTIAKSLQDQIKTSSVEGFDQQRLKIDVEFASLNKELDKLGASDAIRDLAQERFEQQKAAIDRAEAAQMEAEQARAKREEDLAKQKAANEERAQKNSAARVASLDAQVAAAQLRLAGKHDQARLVMLEASYDQQIDMAEGAAEKERLARLKTLEVEALEREFADRDKTKAKKETDKIASKFEVGNFQQASIDRIALNSIATRPPQDPEQKKQTDFLSQIARNTKRGGSAVAA